jgi:hypothetical protein
VDTAVAMAAKIVRMSMRGWKSRGGRSCGKRQTID